MNYLLDTHAFFWLVHPAGGRRAHIVERLTEEGAGVFVSAVSAFEVALKVRLGKFDGAAALVSNWVTAVRELGAECLDVDTRHGLVAGALDWAHRDPFDRLLAAQAIVGELRLVTADPAFRDAPGLVVEPW